MRFDSIFRRDYHYFRPRRGVFGKHTALNVVPLRAAAAAAVAAGNNYNWFRIESNLLRQRQSRSPLTRDDAQSPVMFVVWIPAAGNASASAVSRREKPTREPCRR